MDHRKLLLTATAALVPLTAAAGIAFATPAADMTPAVHAAGVRLADRVNVNADGVKFQTKAPTDVSVVTLTLAPGGTTGWHGHPGLAIIAVTQGTGTLYDANCDAKEYGAGQAFVEDGDDRQTVFRNEGTEPLVVTVSFVSPKGANLLRDQPNPGCPVA